MSIKQITARLNEHTKIEAKNADEAGKALQFFQKLFGVAPKRANSKGDAETGGTVYFAPVMIGKVLSRVLLQLEEGAALHLSVEPKGSGKLQDALREQFAAKGTHIASGTTAAALVKSFAKEAAAVEKEVGDSSPDASKTLKKWAAAKL